MKETTVLSILIAAVLLGGGVIAEAQQARKVYRVGFLRFGSGGPDTNASYIRLRHGLRELGYVEGQNLVIEYRAAERKSEQRAKLAAELVRLKVDVIVIPGARSMIRDVQGITRTLPIVVSGFRVDPVKTGFVDSLARPGGNLTGLTNLDSELQPKRLELLKEAFPRISRVVILWTPSEHEHRMKAMEAAGRALGIQIQSVVTVPPFEHESAFSAISRESPDGFIVATTPLTIRRSHRARVIEFAAKRQLPTIWNRSRIVKEGGLMSYYADRLQIVSSVATFVDKILKGRKPADLPIERPTKFKFIINLKTAKQIGVTIPPNVLVRADEVIK